MGVEGRFAVIKYLIFTFNLIFCLNSLCLFAIGALMLSSTTTVITDAGTVASLGVMAVGLTIFLVSFYGCCGAQRESYCLVATFSALMFFILFLELGLGVTAYFFRGQVRAVVEDEMWSMMERHPKARPEEDVLGKLQSGLKCCGVNNYTDWHRDNGSSSVPDSCCVNAEERCGTDLHPANYFTVIHTEGCVSLVVSALQRNMNLVIGVAIGLVAIQILAIMFGCCLMKGINDFHKYDLAELEPCPASTWKRDVSL